MFSGGRSGTIEWTKQGGKGRGVVARTTGKKRAMRSSVVFLVTFAAFLVLFGGVMIWGVSEYWRQSNQNETPVTPTTPPTGAAASAGFSAADTRRLLLVVEENGAAQGFVLLCAEPAAARMRATPLPRETAVLVGTTQTRLSDLYRTGGTAAVREPVEALLDTTVDHTAVITYEGIRRLVTYLGEGVIFTLPEAVNYTAADGTAVTMKSGARTLSAAQVTDLCAYDQWSGGRRMRAEMLGELTAAIINQYWRPARFDERDTDFQAIMGIWRSDILASQFAAARDGLLFLAQRNQNDICTVQKPTGEFVGAGDAVRFEWAENADA